MNVFSYVCWVFCQMTLTVYSKNGLRSPPELYIFTRQRRRHRPGQNNTHTGVLITNRWTRGSNREQFIRKIQRLMTS